MKRRAAVETGRLGHRPSEPLVRRNQFRNQTHSQTLIPSFDSVREHLPAPILPGHPEWVELYWRAWELAWSNLRQPEPSSGFVSAFIDAAVDEAIYMWNSCFMVLFGLYGRSHFDFMGSLDNFYAKQHADGFICRAIDSYQGRDAFYPFDPDGTGPNILAWAEWRYFRLTGDDGRLARVFWPLMAFHRWFRANRTWPNGAYWATGWSSGMSNQARVPDSAHHHRHWCWIDATAQAALNCTILRKIAAMLEEEELIDELAEEHAKLNRLINDRMWNDEAGHYQDVDPTGHFSSVKSIGAYWLLLDEDIIPDERLAPFIGHLSESWAFKLPHRIPSMSADSEGYNADTGHYWRGGVWSPTNYMVLRGLRTRGWDGLVYEIALNHLQNVASVFSRTNTLWENYAPESDAPGEPSKPDHVGWTGLTSIAILLEDVIGLNVDWPQRRVIWHRRLPSTRQWGIHRFPLGRDGLLHLVGDENRVVVTSDVPFTLEIREREENILLAVTTGTTEIALTGD